MLRARETDYVVIPVVDRFFRSLRDLEDVIDICLETGAALVAASGEIDLSHDQGRLVARLLTSVAKAETERKGARQRAANDQQAKAGKRRTGGPRPFGYEDDHVTPRPAEADAIQWAADALLGGGSVSASSGSGTGAAWSPHRPASRSPASPSSRSCGTHGSPGWPCAGTGRASGTAGKPARRVGPRSWPRRRGGPSTRCWPTRRASRRGGADAARRDRHMPVRQRGQGSDEPPPRPRVSLPVPDPRAIGPARTSPSAPRRWTSGSRRPCWRRCPAPSWRTW